MRNEPLAIVAAVRAVLLFITATGLFTLTDTDIETIVAGIASIYVMVELITTLYGRSRVYSPKTVEETGAVAMIPTEDRVK